ncbi:hypothetical protein GW17_00056463 [Ensete ventricosum]|nr:hypothetical protein GW17_00056463 [Ensete ventricosum]RZR76280.1 hypothetical protein BHM03_00000964 [Ensete ventricosum]
MAAWAARRDGEEQQTTAGGSGYKAIAEGYGNGKLWWRSSNVKRLRMVRLRQREEEAEEGNGEGLATFSRMLARAGQQKWQGSTGGRQHHDRTPKGAI